MSYPSNEVGSIRNLFTPEYRRLITWMRLLTLGTLVGVSGIAGLAHDPRAVGSALLAVAGGLLAAGSWTRLRPILEDSPESLQPRASSVVRAPLIPAAGHA